MRGFVLAGMTIAAAGLAGCGTGVAPVDSKPAMIGAAAFQGIVMGGQQPVAGVALQLYQAGTTGYGSKATAIGSTFQTTSAGNFSVPSYTCAAGSEIYLVGIGGQPIAATMTSPAVTNNNLALMVGLGVCGGADLHTFINVNELTTVASVWALAPFMTGFANIGSPASNTTGLANAFAVINELVNTSTGTLPGPTLPMGATLPIYSINSLADILEQCINSGGGVAGDGSGCGDLFNLAPNATGAPYPTDSITAIMNIAQSPGRNVANLNKLRSPNPVFGPSYDVNHGPNDWTLAITYTGGGLSAPTSIAADAAGSVWVTNSGNASVTKLDYSGTAISTASGFTAGFGTPSAVAIDGGGNAWITDSKNNTVTQLNPTGSGAKTYSGNGLTAPGSLAIDGSGNIWVANTGSNTVSAFTSGGSVLSNSPYSGAGTNAPVGVAITPK